MGVSLRWLESGCSAIVVDEARGLVVCAETGEVLEEGYISDDLLDFIGKVRGAGREEFSNRLREIYREAAGADVVYRAKVKSRRGYRRVDVSVVLARDICRLYQELPVKEAMRILGIRSVEVFYRILRRAGCKAKTERTGRPKRRVSMSLAWEMCRMKEAGASISAIARATGRQPSTVKVTLDRWCAALKGVPRWVAEAYDMGDIASLLRRPRPESCADLAPRREAAEPLKLTVEGRWLEICAELCRCIRSRRGVHACTAEAARRRGMSQGRVEQVLAWCVRAGAWPRGLKV